MEFEEWGPKPLKSTCSCSSSKKTHSLDSLRGLGCLGDIRGCARSVNVAEQVPREGLFPALLPCPGDALAEWARGRRAGGPERRRRGHTADSQSPPQSAWVYPSFVHFNSHVHYRLGHRFKVYLNRIVHLPCTLNHLHEKA